MKRYITVLALSALVCSSCSDFLDVQPEGNATTTSYFLNDQQAIDEIDRPDAAFFKPHDLVS